MLEAIKDGIFRFWEDDVVGNEITTFPAQAIDTGDGVPKYLDESTYIIDGVISPDVANLLIVDEERAAVRVSPALAIVRKEELLAIKARIAELDAENEQRRSDKGAIEKLDVWVEQAGTEVDRIWEMKGQKAYCACILHEWGDGWHKRWEKVADNTEKAITGALAMAKGTPNGLAR